jgi:hypothetical protein
VINSFDHMDNNHMKPEVDITSRRPCHYGTECHGFRNGKCPFSHNFR